MSTLEVAGVQYVLCELRTKELSMFACAYKYQLAYTVPKPSLALSLSSLCSGHLG